MQRRLLVVLGVTSLLGAPPVVSAQAAQRSARASQQRVLSHSGEVRGVVDFCGSQGNSGTLVHIPGRQFQVKTDASGRFAMQYVPEGDYLLQIEVPDLAPVTRSIHVDKDQVTDLGPIIVCPDNDNDSFTVDVDCNDNNPGIHPGALETCDGVDNNCDGEVDEGCQECTDDDGDGFPAQAGCSAARDCNDSVATIFPGATETCNGVDDNCDGDVDEGFDADGDGFLACEGDCNDDDASIHPATLELCDGIDNNCDGVVDDGFDLDGDGVTTCDGDCDDTQSSIFPGALELCDGLDNDCDSGTVDGSGEPLFGQSCDGSDADLCTEGAFVCDGTTLSCSDSTGTNVEICNGIDDDCDGTTDEGDVCVPICGNGILDPGEQCDDGNAVNGDDCLDTCQVATCGDGVVWNSGAGIETCDDGNLNDHDTCPSTCQVAACGDGFLWNENGGTEQCDDGNGSDGDGCSSSCSLEVDVIVSVDSSGSMEQEIGEVQGNINEIYGVLVGSGFDTHILLLGEGLCVAPPLGSGSCPDDNAPDLLHLPVAVGSTAPLVEIVNQYPNYQGFLRTGSEKHIVVVSDDDSSMSAAEFTTTLSTLPEFAGGFVVHSMVDTGIEAGEPIPSTCGDVGEEYIALTSATGGVQGTLVPVTSGEPPFVVVTGCAAEDMLPFFQDIAVAATAP